jgi:hypothetical protein
MGEKDFFKLKICGDLLIMKDTLWKLEMIHEMFFLAKVILWIGYHYWGISIKENHWNQVLGFKMMQKIYDIQKFE